jgi:tRNA (guanine-N7-)-methyltransferase
MNGDTILAVSHPDYRYPTPKNPYWSKIQSVSDRVYSDNQTEQFRGDWKSLFPANPEGALIVEIGCNAGHVAVESADQNKMQNYIGIDWKFKPIFRGAEKAASRGLQNLIFLRAHAERLHFIFGPEEIDQLNLFFPDPWPKKSQMKNRFFSADRLRKIAPLMKKAGHFHIKTDHSGYFQAMSDAVHQCADLWQILDISHDLHRNHPAPHLLDFPEVTLFEKLFIRDKLPIHQLKLQVSSS